MMKYSFPSVRIFSSEKDGDGDSVWLEAGMSLRMNVQELNPAWPSWLSIQRMHGNKPAVNLTQIHSLVLLS